MKTNKIKKGFERFMFAAIVSLIATILSNIIHLLPFFEIGHIYEFLFEAFWMWTITTFFIFVILEL